MNNKNRDCNFLENVLALLNALNENNIEIDNLVEDDTSADLLMPDNRRGFYIACEIIRFMNEMPGGFLIYRADRDEEILYANKALQRIFMCENMKDLREFTGNSFMGIVHPEDLYDVENSIKEQIVKSQYDLDYVEYRIIRKNGDIAWIEDYGHFVHSEAVGDIFYVFLGDATEKREHHLVEKAMLISEKERQAEKLKELIEEYDRERNLTHQEQLRRLNVIKALSINYESILYADLDKDKILPYRLSERTELQFDGGYEPRRLSRYIDSYINTWIYEEDREAVSKQMDIDYIRSKLSENKTYYMNYRVVQNGKVRYMQLRIVDVSKNGKVSQIVMGYKSLDEEIQREMEQKQLLTEALANANLAIVAKNTFLSNISHDIRTPLNAIFGLTALAKKEIDNKAALESYLNRVEMSCDKLLDLLDKVLEVSWLESKEFTLDEVKCDICDILEEVWRAVMDRAEKQNISFSMSMGKIKHSKIYADADKLKQVIMHLANNAVTYTESGGEVLLSAEETEKLSNGYAVYRITVKDNGIGIGKEFSDKIFEPFARESNTTQSGIHGTGLGLTIAKNIVDKMGGTISVKSKVGEGSEFIVEMRFRIQTEQDGADKNYNNGSAMRKKKVLIVEDNDINREIETEILCEFGFSADTAQNGSEAVEKIASAKAGDYDIILMDIQMPIMNGWESAMAIRKLENSSLADIPIIALSANVFESDIQKSVNSGMNAHLKKPIDVPLLIKTINELTS